MYSFFIEMKTRPSPSLVILALTLSLSLFSFSSVAFADGGEDGGGRSSYDTIIAAAAGEDHSSLQGASSQDFHNFSGGINNNVSWDGVGSIDKLNINAASGSPYSENSRAYNGVRQSTLTLGQNSSYFGFDLVNGNSGDSVKFYNKGNLVSTLAVSDLLNKGITSGFVSFSGDANTSWDQIVFSSGGSNAFQTDNWSSRASGWNPNVDGSLQGTPQLEVKNGVSAAITKVSASFTPAAPGAPAPPMTACLAFAGVLLLQTLRRKSA